MEGIAAVNMRMAQIQARIATISFPARTTAAPVTPTGTSFAAVLADVAGTGATSGAGAAGAAAGRLNADGVPVDLVRYGNGRIPAAALAPVGTAGHRLWAPAAGALGSLLDAARRDGVRIGITDSYRSYDEQVDLVRRKGLYSNGGLAAKPGTSDHGWGLAVDLDLDARAQSWMQANAGRFGFVADTPREPWHWAYHPGG